MSANDWMRQSRMDILKYLPHFLSKDPMFRRVAETCNEEHDRLRLALQDLADNFFVNTATWALSLYESFLGIKPGDGIVFRHNLGAARPHPGVVLYRATDTVLERCGVDLSCEVKLLGFGR